MEKQLFMFGFTYHHHRRSIRLNNVIKSKALAATISLRFYCILQSNKTRSQEHKHENNMSKVSRHIKKLPTERITEREML